MAPPRFAPTGARTTPQTNVIGQPAPVFQTQGRIGTPVAPGQGRLGTPVQPQFMPSSNFGGAAAPLPPSRFGFGGSQVASDYSKAVFDQIGARYNRPNAVLGMIFRALRIGENVGAGFSKGVLGQYHRTWDNLTAAASDIASGEFDFGTAKDLIDNVPAWAIMRTLGAGFSEVPDAVTNDMTYEQWIRDSANPDSFWYKHAALMGFGLSIVGDPTTYVTFGATGASKTAAQKLWVHAMNSSYDEAIKGIEAGVIKGKDLQTAAMEIHMAQGRPMSLGDSLSQLRQIDKEGDSAYRRLFPKGGRGIRFAGGEIPGTRALGAGIAKKVLKDKDVTDLASLERVLSRSVYAGFVPDHKLFALADDALRTSAMMKFGDMGRMAAQLGIKQADFASGIAAVDPSKVDFWMQKPLFQRAIHSLFGTQAKPEYIPHNVRKGLLYSKNQVIKNAPQEWQAPLTRMSISVGKAKNDLIKQAVESGADKEDNLLKLWGEHIEQFDDPVEALARFSGHVFSRTVIAKNMEAMLADPMIARVMDTAAEDLDEMYSELDGLVSRKFHLQGRIKGTKNKSLITRTKNQLEGINARIKDVNATIDATKATVKETRTKTGGRAITKSEYERIYQQDAMPFSHKGQKYWVSAPIHEALTNMKNPKYLDTELRKAYRWMNFAQNKWKILATSPNPAFHFMNLVGGMWNNMLAGVNPWDHVTAALDLWRIRVDETTKKGGKAVGQLPGLNRMIQAPVKTSQAIRDYGAYEARATGGSFRAEEMTANRFALARKGGKTKAGKAFTATRRGAALGTIGVLGAEQVLPEDWLPDELENKATLVGAVLLGSPEVIAAGKKLGNDVEEVLRFANFQKWSHDPTMRQAMYAMSVYPPTGHGKYMDEMFGKAEGIQQLMYDIGSAMSLKFQFDYSALTHFERYWAKTFMPFYTFHRKNFVLQAAELTKRPRIMATMEKLENFSDSLSEDEQNGYFDKFLPEYFDKLGMFQVPVPGFIRKGLGLPQDQELYLNPKLPYASLNLFPPVWQLFEGGSITPTPQKFLEVFSGPLGMIGPFAGPVPGAKVMLEYSMGYQLGLARPIDYQRLQSGNFRNSQTDAPGFMSLLPGPLQDWFGVYKDPRTGQPKMNSSMKYVVEQLSSPFINGVGNAVTPTVDSENNRADLVSWMTGIRLTPVDPIRTQRGWLYRTKSYLEARKTEFRQRGEFFPAEDEFLLKSIRAQLKVVENAWDAQQAEVFGNG